MQTVTLLALRAVGVMDARARGLVVQAVLPAKALVGRLSRRHQSELVEPGLPLRDALGEGSAMAGCAGRDGLDLRIAAADRALIGHRKLAEPCGNRLIGFTEIISHG